MQPLRAMMESNLPDIMWQAIFYKIFVLILVTAHVDLPIILPWLSPNGGEIQDHIPQLRAIATIARP